jgi:nucleoside triphosphate diphosphatase
MTDAPKPSRDIQALLDIMQALRDPKTGCPWDIEQNFVSIAPYTIEEAHEVLDAITRNDFVDLKDELGDLLLQVVFHARMAEEQQLFDFGDVVQAITHKMIRRHPHVFGEGKKWTPAEVKASWNRIKAEEKRERALARGQHPEQAPSSVLDGVTSALPPGVRAVRLQAAAAKVGFDWPNIADVIAKAEEELAELKSAVSGGNSEEIEEELGDLLFVLANAARWRDLDPDVTLARANAKFERRFRRVEALMQAAGKEFETSTLAEMDAFWLHVKAEEKPLA